MPGGGGTDGGGPEGEKCPGECVCDGEAETGYFGSGIAFGTAGCLTRDEGMLQEVLDVVGRNLDRLAVSAESVKLLACCYYYVEEKECVERAGRMLEELRKMGRGEEELADVETILEELT